MMKLYFNFLLIISFGIVTCMPVKASKPIVDVQMVDDNYTLNPRFELYAKGVGSGYTLESAKSAAINDIMPLLINKTLYMGSSDYMEKKGNLIEGGGFTKIRAEILIDGWWKLKDGIYEYTIELFMQNDKQNGNAETPLK